MLAETIELALIETSRIQREYQAMINDTNFMAFWRTINQARVTAGLDEIKFGEVYRLWREAMR